MNSQAVLDETGTSPRLHNCLLLLATAAWQSYVVFFCYRHAPIFDSTFGDLGFELPWLTALFLSLYRFTLALPLTFLTLAYVLLRMKRLSQWYYTALVVLGILAGMVLQAFVTEALLAPFLHIVDVI